MQMHYAAVENCGRVALGHYCTHFHHVNDCPECQLVGNAIINGANKGVTVHATHRALIQDNVIYNVKGAGIYFENGQEMDNNATGNAIGCPEKLACRCKSCVPAQADADFNEQSGIYMLSLRQHLIGNHVWGMENALYNNQPAAFGQDAARGKVCTKMLPAGTIRSNVFHNNAGFGFYVNNGFTLNVKQQPYSAGASAGFVSDWGSCAPFSLDSGAVLAIGTLEPIRASREQGQSEAMAHTSKACELPPTPQCCIFHLLRWRRTTLRRT